MANDWHVVIDDTGGQFSGWPSVSSETEDRSVIHRAGFIQEYWGGPSGYGPTLREALEISQVIADHMNAKVTAQPRESTDKFWIIVGGEKFFVSSHYPSNIRYKTPEEAITEAKRLSAIYHSNDFHVMESVANIFSPAPVPIVEMIK